MLFVLLGTIFALGNATGDSISDLQGAKIKIETQLPYHVYEMVRDFVGDDIPNKAIAELSMRQFDDFDGKGAAYFLYARIENEFDRTLCIPSVFYNGENIIQNQDILSLFDENNDRIAYRMYASKFGWPNKKYVLLYPGAKDTTYINVSAIYDLDEASGDIDIEFKFPAFFCDAMQEGYPISEEMLGKRSIGMRSDLPVVAISKSDIVVYKGKVSFKIE